MGLLAPPFLVALIGLEINTAHVQGVARLTAPPAK